MEPLFLPITITVILRKVSISLREKSLLYSFPTYYSFTFPYVSRIFPDFQIIISHLRNRLQKSRSIQYGYIKCPTAANHPASYVVAVISSSRLPKPSTITSENQSTTTYATFAQRLGKTSNRSPRFRIIWKMIIYTAKFATGLRRL